MGTHGRIMNCTRTKGKKIHVAPSFDSPLDKFSECSSYLLIRNSESAAMVGKGIGNIIMVKHYPAVFFAVLENADQVKLLEVRCRP